MNLDLNAKRVGQKKKMFALDRQRTITDMADKLKITCFIKKVKFPTWLSNVVLVKKANGKW